MDLFTISDVLSGAIGGVLFFVLQQVFIAAYLFFRSFGK